MSYSNPKERELLARVERLEAELKRLQAQYEAEVERRSAIEIELHAELERLRKDNSAFGPITQTVREENKRLEQDAETVMEEPDWAIRRAALDRILARLEAAEEALRPNGRVLLTRITELEAELERLRGENWQLLLTKAGAFKAQMKYAAENERLREELSIEEAARDWLEHPHEQAALNALRTALEKDPDREFTSGRETFPFGEEV